jgi:hypothetical protein
MTGVGTCTIVASQAGNDNYNAGSAEQSFSIAKADQAITFGALSNKTYGDPDFTVSATGGASGNAVTFAAKAGSKCTVSGSTVSMTGAGTCTIIASQAGNENYTAATSVERSFTIAAWTFSGFYQPVDMGRDSAGKPIVNTVKAGSTVPMKFEVFKAGSELRDVPAVKGTTAVKIDCSALSLTTDEIEVLASGSTSLRFDATSDQFIYNWKTPVVGCYAFTVTTQDGSSLTAYFKTR